MKNMRIWNEVSAPPSEALKTIGGGRLKGMTDIKPQWRFKVMTEIFGPCGIGWKYEITSMREVPCSNGEVAVFVDVNLYFKEEDNWSAPIPGSGGSMLVSNEKNGAHVSDEAFKMATTDALSTAMKYIGVAADVYMGMWDGSKYKEQPKELVKVPPKVKEQVLIQSTKCLEQGDETGLKQIWSEFDADEKVVLWGMFNSQQRAAIKELMK
jgi:hypothetical protein